MKTSKLLNEQWGRITQLTFTADNRWLVSGSADSDIQLWNLGSTDNKQKPLLLKNKQCRLTSFAISDDGRWLATAGASYTTNDVMVRLWDLHAEEVVASVVDLSSYRGELSALAVSRTGDYVATGNKDGMVRLWHVGASHAVSSTDLCVHGESVRAMCFAPDGRSLITAARNESGKGTVQVWGLDGSAATGDLALTENSQGAEQVAITTDSRWLFTANPEPSLRVRDLTRLSREQTSTALAGQNCVVQSMAVSTNNRWLAVAGTDNAVRLWSLGASGPAETPITLRPHGAITVIAFVRRGDWLATADDRGCVQLWNLQLDELIRIANARMSR
jgi:WD40 repeat protein